MLRRRVGWFESGLVLGVRGGPVSGQLERGDYVADGSGVGAEGVAAGVGAVATLEVPPHDPVVEYPAVRAEPALA
jgi:hypothetical protein